MVTVLSGPPSCFINDLMWHLDCDFPAMQSRAKVLVVEDDNAMAQMCAKLIRRRGHSVVIACSAQDALAIVRSAGDVDVVISDVQMPSMTGIELLGGLRAIDGNLPVILMTGYANVLTPAQAVELGATDFLAKPFDSDAFIGSLERALRSKGPQPAAI